MLHILSTSNKGDLKMSRLTKNKIDFIDNQLSNNDFSSDAELILDIAGEIGKRIKDVAKLVKTERIYFLQGVVLEPAKVIRKYLK
jgi:hypothetical protein